MYKNLADFLIAKIDVDQSKLDYILDHFSLVKTKRNEIIIHQGEICKHFYFVNKGCLRLYTISKDGKDTTRYFAFEDTFGTALPSFIEQIPSFEFAQTIEKSELLKINRDDFFHLINEVPQFADIYRYILERAFITSQKRIYGFQGFDSMEKVKWVMNYYPQLLVRVSNKMAASYLGLTPSTLSRVKRKL